MKPKLLPRTPWVSETLIQLCKFSGDWSLNSRRWNAMMQYIKGWKIYTRVVTKNLAKKNADGEYILFCISLT